MKKTFFLIFSLTLFAMGYSSCSKEDFSSNQFHQEEMIFKSQKFKTDIEYEKGQIGPASCECVLTITVNYATGPWLLQMNYDLDNVNVSQTFNTPIVYPFTPNSNQNIGLVFGVSPFDVNGQASITVSLACGGQGAKCLFFLGEAGGSPQTANFNLNSQCNITNGVNCSPVPLEDCSCTINVNENSANTSWSLIAMVEGGTEQLVIQEEGLYSFENPQNEDIEWTFGVFPFPPKLHANINVNVDCGNGSKNFFYLGESGDIYTGIYDIGANCTILNGF